MTTLLITEESLGDRMDRYFRAGAPVILAVCISYVVIVGTIASAQTFAELKAEQEIQREFWRQRITTQQRSNTEDIAELKRQLAERKDSSPTHKDITDYAEKLIIGLVGVDAAYRRTRGK